MLPKPDTCIPCPLYTKGRGYVPDDIAKRADYIFYGEAPGSNEVELNKPFQGKAGFVLKNWLLRAVPLLQMAEEKRKVSYMNVLRCLPPEVQGRPYPKGEEKRQAEACCSQYMDLKDTRTIVLLGESPQRYFFGEELEAEDASDKRLGRDAKGVMGRIGRVYEKDGRTWIFAPHPAYILRQPALVEHGQMAFQIATGAEKVVEPAYIGWADALMELA